MYYLEMNLVANLSTNLKTVKKNHKISQLVEKENNSITATENKIYQKSIVILISLSVILIFPEAPKEWEDICLNNHKSQICNVW